MDDQPSYMHQRKRSHSQLQQHANDGSSSNWPFHHPLPTFLEPDPLRHRPAPHEGGPSRYRRHFDSSNGGRSILNDTDQPPNVSRASQTSGRNVPTDIMSGIAPRRFAGDGFDYRRPARAAREESEVMDLTGSDDGGSGADTPQDTVIDLTADDSGYGASHDEQSAASQENGQNERRRPVRRQNSGTMPRPRPPRGMDIIIDLDNGEEHWMPASPPPAADATGPVSPEIEFISERRIGDDIQERIDRLHRLGHDDPENDDIQFLREEAVPEDVRRRQQQARSHRELDQVMNIMHMIGEHQTRFVHVREQVQRSLARINARTGGPDPPPRNMRTLHIHAFARPNLDFEAVGFDIGNGQPPAPPPPTYNAPEAAAEGFTRSPEENDTLVCPNCGDELCVGEEDLKRQVWVVKACGHVYCGECTQNRSSKRSSKGKERPANTAPFKQCKVEGCDKSVVHKKNMIQVFM